MNLFRNHRVSMLVLAALLLPHFGHSQNYIRKVPQETYYVKEGDDIEIPCVALDPDVKCMWLRSGTILLPNKNYVYEVDSANGDCSLKLKNVSLFRDNATLECQVPSYNQGGPSYKPNWPRTSVIVMVKPRAPSFKEEPFPSIPAEQVKSLVCESLAGNPLPSLEWYLNNENITANASTTVKGESVTSTLNYVFKKQNNGATLTCVSVHRLEKQTTKKLLNVTYRPIVSVERRVYNMHDGQDLEIECQVDANPPAGAIWKTSNDGLTKDYKMSGNKLVLSKVNGSKMDGKEFQCSSINSIGSSEVATVILNVSYRPRIVGSKKSPTYQKVQVGGDLELFCEIAGNPKPIITWTFVDSVHYQEHNPKPVDPSKLVVHNVSYLNEGDYYCVGENKIGNDIHKALSDKMVVDVFGKPQFLSPNEPVIGYQNTNTLVEAIFCSDPPPTRVEWSYDSIPQHIIETNFRKKTDESNFFEVEEGIHIKAGPLVPIDQKKAPNHTCFKTMLFIVNTDIADAKEFIVMVANVNNRVEKVIHLQVYNKMSGAMIISISLIVLLMLFVLTILFVFFLRRRSSDQLGHEDSEDKSDSHVPIHTTGDDAAKQATIEKVL